MGFTDIHSHIVYGLDDGAQTKEDMHCLLDTAYQQGIRTIYATSHDTPGMKPFFTEKYIAHLEEGRQYCLEQGYEMKLYPGAELLYTPAMDPYIHDHRLITLGETDHVLVEFVPNVERDELITLLEKMELAGYKTILAHIERYSCMKGQFPFKLKKNYNVQFQVNCRTVVCPHGMMEKYRIYRWLKTGIIDYIATDMHHATKRPPMMKDAYDRLCSFLPKKNVDWLTHAEGLQQDEQ